MKRFANFDVVVRSWYVACRSRAVARGAVRTFDMLDRRIAIWRDASGTLHAVDARCPHLGADLGCGDVVGGRVRCAFHHWEFDGDGTCAAAPGLAEPPARRVRSYPVMERWGLVWVFNGPAPDFDVPTAPEGRRAWRLPRQFIRCHPHLVVGNGLDVSHFEALHDLAYTREPVFAETANGFSVEIAGRPRSQWTRRLTGTRDRDVSARFTTVGGNIAWLEMCSPLAFEVLFTGLPADGGCWTQTVVFMPRGFAWKLPRAFFILKTVLGDDRRVLDRLQFAPGWTARDEPMRRFTEAVERMEVW